MIIGVVGDTHNHISNVGKIIDIFNSSVVECVFHTGDITQAKTLEKFSRLGCPLYIVYGNNDLEEEGLIKTATEGGFIFQAPPLSLRIEGRNIAIFHEPNKIEEFIKQNPFINIIIHGHTHRFRDEKIGNVRVINPGECAGMIKGKNAIGLIDLKDLNFKRIFF